MNRAIMTALFVLCASKSLAGFSGNDLYELCTSDTKSAKAVCETWISGFQAGIFAANLGAKTNLSACLPVGFTGNQAKLIIEKFMKDFPATLHNKAEVVALFALSREFPCKGSNSN